MDAKNNNHIFVGLGTLVFVLGGAILVKKLVNTKKRIKTTKTNRVHVDLSVFDSPDAQGSGSCIDSRLVSMLMDLKQKTGYPIFRWINSGVRTAYWNKKVGGVRNSSHEIPNCKAVDIKASSIAVRNNLVLKAKEVGFKRIGVGKTFVHLDVDTNKSQYVAWGYPSGARAPINPFV